MKVQLDLDEKLVAKEFKFSRQKPLNAKVDMALQNRLKRFSQKHLLELKGKIKWEGSLKEMRSID